MCNQPFATEEENQFLLESPASIERRSLTTVLQPTTRGWSHRSSRASVSGKEAILRRKRGCVFLICLWGLLRFFLAVRFTLATVKNESRHIVVCNSVFSQLASGSCALPSPAAR